MTKASNLKPKPRARKERGPALGPLDLKQRIDAALRTEFPNDTIDISDGYKGNVHVMVISRKFDGRNERDRQAWLEEIIAAAGLTKRQLAKISLLLALSPGEIK